MRLPNAVADEIRHIHTAFGQGFLNGTLRPVVGRELPLANAASRHRLGHKIHTYGFPMTASSDPMQYRRNYGLLVWSNDYDGVTPYCFMHNYNGVWNDLDNVVTHNDLNIAFHTINGAVSTLALEALREGTDDARYATLLLRRIEETQRNRMPEAKAVAEEASRWIAGVVFATADLDLVRARMIEYISTLTREEHKHQLAVRPRPLRTVGSSVV